MKRRDVLTILGGVGALSGWSADLGARATQALSGPVRLIVPNPPGGGTDLVARLLIAGLSRAWPDAQVVVDYRPGAGMSIGTAHVARARPDGSTLGIIATPHVINPWLMKLPYDTEHDLLPVSRVGTSDLLLGCSPRFGATELGDALTRIRTNPGRFNCATGGQGSSMHLTLELLKQRAGLQLEHVPFKGAGPAFVELITGRMEFMIEPLFSSLPYVRDGRMVPLATTGRSRSRHLPQVPVLHEMFPGLIAQSFFGVVAPGGMEAELAEHIHAGISASLSGETAQTQIATIGFDPAVLGPQAFREFLSVELGRWREVARRANLASTAA